MPNTEAPEEGAELLTRQVKMYPERSTLEKVAVTLPLFASSHFTDTHIILAVRLNEVIMSSNCDAKSLHVFF